LGGATVPPSVSRILLNGTKAGAAVPLAPSISDVTPARGSVLHGGRLTLRARVTDALSGVGPAQVTVEVDGHRVAVRFDAASGRLTAPLRLARGRHTLWIRAVNRAHSPAAATIRVTVR
jgi:Bacterial Ig domain